MHAFVSTIGRDGVTGGFQMQLDDAASVLSSADFFSICNAEQCRMLGFASERRVFLSGDTLFRRGDVIDGAYVLMSGTLESSDGGTDSVPTEISDRGTVVGELALLTSHPRRATLTAKTDCELLMVPRHAFIKLLQQFPDLTERTQNAIRQNLNAFVRPIAETGKKIKSR